MMGLSIAQATALLKHFYSGTHYVYPECVICLPDKIAALKARLRAKYMRGNHG